MTMSRLTIARRALLGILPAMAAAPHPAAAQDMDQCRCGWAAFRDAFLAPEGRVVDTANAGVSHTEGQGWALLMAVHADDRPSFDLILGWTRRVLQHSGDMLHAWRYQPNAARPVDDPNNASDGDLCIAWALLLAAERWGEGGYAAQGVAIARDVLRLLVRGVGDYSVLLPAMHGFQHHGKTVVNLSYYVFPALAAAARAVPDPAWARLAADGLVLLRRARFGRWGLPPDWLEVHRSTGAVAPAEGWPARFSFDAVRVPLWLAWAGLEGEPALHRAHEFWATPPQAQMPAWTDLLTDGLAPYPASPGVACVARLTEMMAAQRIMELPQPADLQQQDYYSAALTVLSGMAASARAARFG